MNTGHGHVIPRHDGVKARCGGPGICTQCSQELAQLKAKSQKLVENDPEKAAEGAGCQHRRLRNMTWPDNCDSELCIDCLLTRHHWEQGSTEWQDHNYKSAADWYYEAFEVEEAIEDCLRTGAGELVYDPSQVE